MIISAADYHLRRRVLVIAYCSSEEPRLVRVSKANRLGACPDKFRQILRQIQINSDKFRQILRQIQINSDKKVNYDEAI